MEPLRSTAEMNGIFMEISAVPDEVSPGSLELMNIKRNTTAHFNMTVDNIDGGSQLVN